MIPLKGQMKRITTIAIFSLVFLMGAGYCYTRMQARPHIARFVIKHKSDKVDLVWRSTSTPFLQSFIVEKSLDGNNFEPLDTINAVPDTKQSYTYIVSDRSRTPGKLYRLSFTNNLSSKFSWKTIVNSGAGATAGLMMDSASE